jgi:hypothetical protein
MSARSRGQRARRRVRVCGSGERWPWALMDFALENTRPLLAQNADTCFVERHVQSDKSVHGCSSWQMTKTGSISLGKVAGIESMWWNLLGGSRPPGRGLACRPPPASPCFPPCLSSPRKPTAAIRTAYEQEGELSAAGEPRRLFPASPTTPRPGFQAVNPPLAPGQCLPRFRVIAAALFPCAAPATSSR